MNICLVNPGILPIPRLYYGAIERIIQDQQTFLTKLGCNVDIKFSNEINPNNYDIVGSHTWNQTIELSQKSNKKNIVNFIQDHHVTRIPSCYQNNLKAIKESPLTMFHTEEFINLFNECYYKIFFLPQSVNTDFFVYKEKTFDKHKLLIVAANGFSDDSLADRKGFRLCIEAAKKLDLNLTICGPSKNNEPFFRANPDLLNYSKLNIIYDTTDKELLDIYHNHTIFLHPSSLEFGCPNLTLLESLACGLPNVSTYRGSKDIPGLKRVNPEVSEVSQGLEEVIKNYKQYRENTKIAAKEYSYETNMPKLLTIFESLLESSCKYNTNFDFKTKFINAYENTPILVKEQIAAKDDQININFIDGAFVEITGNSDKTYFIEFINRDNNNVIFNSTLKVNTWAKVNFKYFINYDIRIKDEAGKLILRHLFDGTGRRIFISLESKSIGDQLAWLPFAEEFRKQHNCKLIVSTFMNSLFKREYPEIEFVEPGVSVLNIYAQYNIGLYWDNNDTTYNKNIHPLDPRIIPLQKIASDILGLSFKEIAPKITISNKENPRPNSKYVTISPNSTALCKYWLNPNGWQIVIDYLRGKNYEVIIIQKEKETDFKNVILLEDKNLQTALTYLLNSEFHISVSTGIAWLNWALNKKTILISGMTKIFNEFNNNTIKINPKNYICNGCFNDSNYVFGGQAKGDWEYCPNHKNLKEKFICSKSISSNDVIKAIDQYIKE